MPSFGALQAELETPRLTDEQIRTLATYGHELRLEEGEFLFDENGVVNSFFVVVEGEVGISRLDGAEETPPFIHRAGEFTGGLAILTGKSSIHRARVLTRSRVIEIDSETFRRVALEEPDISDVFISALARRMRATQRAYRQHEKFAALGKLSAGLAHELNNPAAAARRASEGLEAAILDAQASALRHDGRFDDGGRRTLDALQQEILSRPESPQDSLALGDAEDRLALWLEGRGAEDAWELAPVLAGAGVEERDLRGLSDAFALDAFAGAVRWLAGTLELVGLVREISASTGRISELVGAVKGYTFMDRSARTEVDVVEGIENALTIMGGRLAGISVVREYEEGLPKTPGRGGELNQVWSNLIENAVDAVNGEGTVTLRTFKDGDAVLVEVSDDGPGIPREIRTRVFEPFFTTKDVGAGAGLGLDVVRRVVADHGGEVSMETGPEGATFRVRLPAGTPGTGESGRFEG